MGQALGYGSPAPCPVKQRGREQAVLALGSLPPSKRTRGGGHSTPVRVGVGGAKRLSRSGAAWKRKGHSHVQCEHKCGRRKRQYCRNESPRTWDVRRRDRSIPGLVSGQLYQPPPGQQQPELKRNPQTPGGVRPPPFWKRRVWAGAKGATGEGAGEAWEEGSSAGGPGERPQWNTEVSLAGEVYSGT